MTARADTPSLGAPPAQDSDASRGREGIKEDLKILELRLRELEHKRQVKKRTLQMQLETAIRRRDVAKKKYEELVNKFKPRSPAHELTSDSNTGHLLTLAETGQVPALTTVGAEETEALVGKATTVAATGDQAAVAPTMEHRLDNQRYREVLSSMNPSNSDMTVQAVSPP